MRTFAALALTALTACATTSISSAGANDGVADAPATRAEKDRAACRKMCEVAGDAEGNTDAVADCQTKCDAAP